MNTQWLTIRENLQKLVSTGAYKVWITPLHGEVDGLQVNVYAPNSFFADFVRSHWNREIHRAAALVLGAEPVVRIGVEKGSSASSDEASPSPVKSSMQRAPEPRVVSSPSDTVAQAPIFSCVEQGVLPYAIARRPVTWRYDFAGFVVGPSNELAHAAALSMTRDTAAVDTLFLSSASGLGKTHLAQAVGQAVCKSGNRGLHVEYLTAEVFSTSFVHALKTKDVSGFKRRFCTADLLLLEDVEFLQKKEKMQEEVLSVIKALQSRGSRVVLTSSFAPKDLRDLDSQLVSRFCSGFLAGIEKPDMDTRLRILREKALAQKATLPAEVAQLLAESLCGDVRQMESCLSTLILRAKLLERDLSVQLAREALVQYVEVRPLNSIDEITRKVCEGFGLTAPQLQSRSRRKNYVLARNTIFFLARKHTDLSLQEIGDHFGRRHSTVIKGIAAIERELKKETPLGRQVAATLSRIEQN